MVMNRKARRAYKAQSRRLKLTSPNPSNPELLKLQEKFSQEATQLARAEREVFKLQEIILEVHKRMDAIEAEARLLQAPQAEAAPQGASDVVPQAG